MTSFFTPQTGYSLHLCAESGIRPASWAATLPFYVPEPSSERVVAMVAGVVVAAVAVVVVAVVVVVLVLVLVLVVVVGGSWGCQRASS